MPSYVDGLLNMFCRLGVWQPPDSLSAFGANKLRDIPNCSNDLLGSDSISVFISTAYLCCTAEEDSMEKVPIERVPEARIVATSSFSCFITTGAGVILTLRSVRAILGSVLTSAFSKVGGAVTEISLMNLDCEGDTGADRLETCLLLVKFSDLKVEQLLNNKTIAKAGSTFLTITSFFLG